jgi:hypothetical protein
MSTDVVCISEKANPFVEIGYADIIISSHLIGLYNANANAKVAWESSLKSRICL